WPNVPSWVKPASSDCTSELRKGESIPPDRRMRSSRNSIPRDRGPESRLLRGRGWLAPAEKRLNHLSHGLEFFLREGVLMIALPGVEQNILRSTRKAGPLPAETADSIRVQTQVQQSARRYRRAGAGRVKAKNVTSSIAPEHRTLQSHSVGAAQRGGWDTMTL